MKMFLIARRAVLAALCSFVAVLAVSGQTRINDKDLENLMRNLRDDAKSFRSPFSSALKKSTIRKTSQAKDAENLAESFAKQTEALLNSFKQTKKGDANLSSVQSTGQQLGAIVRNYLSNSQVSTRWDKIQTELQQVLSAYGIQGLPDRVDENPRGITPDSGAASNAGSCSQAVGPERAQRLVQECLQVSPATRPPCNAQNSCVLIIDEIKRGCALLKNQAPRFCDEYQ
jgi:predicted component of type VI protein secretion system